MSLLFFIIMGPHPFRVLVVAISFLGSDGDEREIEPPDDDDVDDAIPGSSVRTLC